MQKRIFAIIALILFALGLALFMISIAAGSNDYTFYAVIFCAPGTLLVFMNYMAQKREDIRLSAQTKQEEGEGLHDEELD